MYIVQDFVTLCHISVQKYGKFSVDTAYLPYYGGCSGNGGHHCGIGVFHSEEVYVDRSK